MADTISGIGSFIPNKAGNPKILTLDPADRAKFLAEKAAREERALEPVRNDDKSVQPVRNDESVQSEVAPAVDNRGENISIDV